MVEFGYMEGEYLHSRFIKPISRVYIDKEGVQQTEIISVEQQVAELSEVWKPVDVINEEQMRSNEEDYVVIPVPYDAGDRISYNYVKKFDTQKIRKEIQDIKDALSATDYKITKCYEASLIGNELPYDVASLHEERQAQRDRINELEALLEQAI